METIYVSCEPEPMFGSIGSGALVAATAIPSLDVGRVALAATEAVHG